MNALYKKQFYNVAAVLCAMLSGVVLATAARESQSQAGISAEQPSVVSVPEVVIPATPDIPDLPVPPPLAPSVDAQDVVALVPASGECPGGVCAPRAATVQRYQPQTRRGLFGGRFRR